MVQKTQSNFILVSANIMALAHFLTPRPSWTLALFLYFSQTARIPDIKTKMQLVSVFSLLAAFTVTSWLSDFFSVCALGLAMNTGYQIDSSRAPWLINSSLGLGIIVGELTKEHLPKFSTSRDVCLLIFTLPNFFMAQNSKQSKENQILWFIGPYMDPTWTYALGFIGGIFFPQNTLTKHTRFFIISLILLLSIFTDNQQYIQAFSLLRGLLVYNQSKHQSEFYFRVGFIIVDLFFKQYLTNYLFLGYLVIAVILWQVQASGSRLSGARQARRGTLEEPLIGQNPQPNKNKPSIIP